MAAWRNWQHALDLGSSVRKDVMGSTPSAATYKISQRGETGKRTRLKPWLSKEIESSILSVGTKSVKLYSFWRRGETGRTQGT